MRSTHACTPTFAHFSSQYSRRLLSILAQPYSQQTQKKNIMILLLRVIMNFVFVATVYTANLHSCATQKKMRSTHTCTPTFASSSQYSRRLLSILAQNETKNNKRRKVLFATLKFEQRSLFQQQYLNDFFFFANYSSSFRKKKC